MPMIFHTSPSKEEFVMSQKTIAVLFGGCSTEHSVSLQSAQAVLRAINREQYLPAGHRHHPGGGRGASSPATRTGCRTAPGSATPAVFRASSPPIARVPVCCCSVKTAFSPNRRCFSRPARQKRRGRHTAGTAGTGRNPDRRLRHARQRSRDGQGQGAPPRRPCRGTVPARNRL